MTPFLLLPPYPITEHPQQNLTHSNFTHSKQCFALRELSLACFPFPSSFTHLSTPTKTSIVVVPLQLSDTAAATETTHWHTVEF